MIFPDMDILREYEAIAKARRAVYQQDPTDLNLDALKRTYNQLEDAVYSAADEYDYAAKYICYHYEPLLEQLQEIIAVYNQGK